MSNLPLAPVTVIIPCFDCSTTIHRAIQSIVEQIQKPKEIILVDDASGDDTLQVIEHIKQQYPDWIKIIALTENQGAASARNAGWNKATQTYIAFLDADDTWHPEKIHIQFQFMCDNPKIALSGQHSIRFKTNATALLLPNLQITKISGMNLLFRNAFHTSTVMLKSTIPLRFQTGKRFAEDLLLWQQIAFSGFELTHINIPLAYIHKPVYGTQGLSAKLVQMERGELHNFIILYRLGHINILLATIAITFSVGKFIKRLVMVKFIKNYLITHEAQQL